MALFARRRIQEAIDSCRAFMPAEAIKRKVAELNASNRGSLPAEWEVMLAAAVSRLCPVAYEPDLGGPRRVHGARSTPMQRDQWHVNAGEPRRLSHRRRIAHTPLFCNRHPRTPTEKPPRAQGKGPRRPGSYLKMVPL